MAKILFINMAGIGNCILSTPTLAALHIMGHDIDVVIDGKKSTWVAFGAWHRVSRILDSSSGLCERIRYDYALWAHPAHSGLLYNACVSDSVDPLPGDPRDYQWRFDRHEVIEIMELARRLGYMGEVPSIREPLFDCSCVMKAATVAIGIGYTKAIRWENKHWGNDNYIELCKGLISAGLCPILVGDDDDQYINGWKIALEAGVVSICGRVPIVDMLGIIKHAICYVGNDTGFMHAAAAFGIPTLGIFCSSNPIKNAPWGRIAQFVQGDSSPSDIALRVIRLASLGRNSESECSLSVSVNPLLVSQPTDRRSL